MYAPSFILDVPASSVRDENTDDYLREVDATFEGVAKILQTQLA
jgi:histone deacetylase 8